MSTEPRVALARLIESIDPASLETVDPRGATVGGRVLGSAVALDRDSPACDVSAMDGYAVRLADLREGPLPLRGERRPGEPPAPLPLGAAVRIYTGSPVPAGADTVVRLERATAESERLTLLPEAAIADGADIRRQGENAAAGSSVLSPGQPLTPAAAGALATCGPASIQLFERLRVVIVTTGSELDSAGSTTGEPLPAWRLRDSNGPSLLAMLADLPWIAGAEHRHADDTPEAVGGALTAAISQADAVVLTGGVSKGAYDFVPGAIEQAGGKIVFHRIRARPGQPTLGAVLGGKPVIGLPGNPMSVLCAGRRLLIPALRKRAGFAVVDPPTPRVELTAWSGKPLPITWWRPVRLIEGGRAELVSLRGSGDVIGPAASDGFVEVPPTAEATGPFDYYAWRP